MAGFVLAAGCGVGFKQAIISRSVGPDEQRRQTLEATLRVLDEHPEYVDEFFALAQKHPGTLDRFIANAAGHLDEPGLAKLTARHLVESPRGLEEILVQTLDAAQTSESRQAIARAIQARPKEAARALLSEPSGMQALSEEMLVAIEADPAAQAAFASAIAARPGTATALMAEIARQLAAKGVGGSGKAPYRLTEP